MESKFPGAGTRRGCSMNKSSNRGDRGDSVDPCGTAGGPSPRAGRKTYPADTPAWRFSPQAVRTSRAGNIGTTRVLLRGIRPRGRTAFRRRPGAFASRGSKHQGSTRRRRRRSALSVPRWGDSNVSPTTRARRPVGQGPDGQAWPFVVLPYPSEQCAPGCDRSVCPLPPSLIGSGLLADCPRPVLGLCGSPERCGAIDRSAVGKFSCSGCFGLCTNPDHGQEAGRTSDGYAQTCRETHA